MAWRDAETSAWTFNWFCLILCGWLALKAQDYQLKRMKKIGMGPRMWRAGSGRQTGRRPLGHIGAPRAIWLLSRLRESFKLSARLA
jgi:hypothetical protein